MSEIRRLNRRLREAEEQAAALEASTSYQLGHSLVEVARSPRKVTRVGRELVRLWRGRASGRGRPRPARSRGEVDSLAAYYQAIRVSPERLLLAHGTGDGGPRTRLVVAGVVRDETAAVLAPDTWLHRLSPNDAVVAVERADPDVVLIETGAFGAGRPWAYTGSPGLAERDRRLLEVIDAARAMGRPAVLWWTAAAPEPVGLLRLADRFDLVLTARPDDGAAWTPGVQLATFNDVDLDPLRAAAALFVGEWDPRLAPARRDRFAALLEASRAYGLDIRLDPHALGGAESFPASLRGLIHDAADPTAVAGLYRSHPLVIGDPRPDGLAADRVREALACGARIVALVSPDLVALDGDAVRQVVEAADGAAAMAAATAMSPRSATAVRAVARGLFVDHAVPTRLADLASRLGLRLDPLAGRRITLVLDQRDRADDARLVSDVLGQAHRPVQVIVRGRDLSAEARAALAAAAIEVAEPAADGTPANWAQVADRATAPWVAAWSTGTPHPRHDLLDLAMAGEMSRADAVGRVADGPSRFVHDLAAGASLVRRELLAGVPPAGAAALPDAWTRDVARRGARLFGITDLDDAMAG